MDNIPLEIVKHILSYDKRFVIRNGKIIQINRIDHNDKRYQLLMKLPVKEYYPINNITYLYLSINDEKDFFITYKDYEIQIQILLYKNSNNIVWLGGHKILIE
jgi:hypothetical protein